MGLTEQEARVAESQKLVVEERNKLQELSTALQARALKH